MTGFQKGQWDMFETITNIYFGKQYYFLESEKETKENTEENKE